MILFLYFNYCELLTFQETLVDVVVSLISVSIFQCTLFTVAWHTIRRLLYTKCLVYRKYTVILIILSDKIKNAVYIFQL